MCENSKAKPSFDNSAYNQFDLTDKLQLEA